MKNNKILLINKPPGPTSHDIVDKVRKLTGEKRVGHSGTLDPFAEGLLILLVGREATKKQGEFMKLDKEYIATLHLGAETDTDDKTGKPIKAQLQTKSPKTEFYNTHDREYSRIFTKVKIQNTIEKFIGDIEQVPPKYSAVKVGGKRAYKLAREGKKVELKPRKIKIYNIKILSYNWPLLAVKIRCSSGTYIRSLARDIGQELGCGAYVERLVRTKIGNYRLKDTIKVDDISKS